VISRWAQKKDTIQASDGKKLRKSSCSGKNGLLKNVESELLEFIIDVNRFTLLRKAGTLKPEILNKTERAAKICLSRFLAKNNLTHCVATHMAQRDPREVKAEVLEFLEYIPLHLDDGSRDPNYIINMDQTPVYHAMNARTTIERVGTRTVNMRTSMGDSKRVTVAATITASGMILPTMVVFKGESSNYDCHQTNHAYRYLFKGKRTGVIAKEELPILPAGLIYRVQEKAWFSKDIMLDWIEFVLKPHVANVTEGIVPILFLDSFTVHKMGCVVHGIQALGIEVDFIPPGCTSMVQPVNVGYNKPFKAKVREQYRNWMLAQDPDKAMPAAKRSNVTEWILMAERNITEASIKNAQRKTGFSWFPHLPKAI
jgi:hypothetical protein